MSEKLLSPSRQAILTMASLTKEVHRPTIRASALVFEDPSSRELQQHLVRIAPSNANILIVGETGTGKELVARFVHQASERANGPFVAVNCGTFVETLVEAELFGHEKGAFTGAISGKPGWFEAANGGTIFLDEIGDLAPSLQVKLLRVLQEREVVRVGARQPIPIDVRVIAATNIDLEQAVRLGRFRQDLFYRLNVARVDLRPLRDRPGDILPLADHFLASYAVQQNRHDLYLGDAAMQALVYYAWPGNIRELENVIHHAVLVAQSPAIVAADLSLSHHGLRPITPGPTPAGLTIAGLSMAGLGTTRLALTGSTQTGSAEPPNDALDGIFRRLFDQDVPSLYEHVSQQLIRAALDHCEGNQVQTARLLGISRNVLRAHLAKLGVIAARLKKPSNENDVQPPNSAG
jgi:sigma-54-specific transcriptional regulator